MKITIDATPMELCELFDLMNECDDFDDCDEYDDFDDCDEYDECDNCLNFEIKFDNDEEDEDDEPEFSKEQIEAARVAARMILDDFFKDID